MFKELFIKLLQQGLHSVLKGKDGSPEMVNKWELFFWPYVGHEKYYNIYRVHTN